MLQYSAAAVHGHYVSTTTGYKPIPVETKKHPLPEMAIIEFFLLARDKNARPQRVCITTWVDDGTRAANYLTLSIPEARKEFMS